MLGPAGPDSPLPSDTLIIALRVTYRSARLCLADNEKFSRARYDQMVLLRRVRPCDPMYVATYIRDPGPLIVYRSVP